MSGIRASGTSLKDPDDDSGYSMLVGDVERIRIQLTSTISALSGDITCSSLTTPSLTVTGGFAGAANLLTATSGAVAIFGSLTVTGGAVTLGDNTTRIQIGSTTGNYIGFFGTTPIPKPAVTGPRATLPPPAQSMLTALANLGLVIDGTF